MDIKKPNSNHPIILIVDDQAANRLALKRLLKNIDADLVEVNSGEEALLQAVALDNLALILLDANMPGMNGFEAAELLREEVQTRHIPLIFISAIHRDEQYILKGYTSGAIDYITKPIHPEILIAKATIFLQTWRLHFELEQEIQRRNELEETNKFLAEHDALTQLPNRRRLFHEIERAIAHADRVGHRFALLFIDLDGFKGINDALGHKAGDKTLITLAQRLSDTVRKTDTVARFGGDEFIILLTGIIDIQHLTDRIYKLLSIAKQPIGLQGEAIELSASIGIAVYPDAAVNQGSSSESIPEILLNHADLAMYKAKERKDTFCFFSENINQKAHRRAQVSQHLRHAIQRQEMAVYFQPIVDVSNGELIGVEALLRWSNATLGEVAPDYFIPIAESMGLIHGIECWVLQQAITQFIELRGWMQKNKKQINNRSLRLSVNVSALQFKNSDWFNVVKKILKQYNFLSQDLEIEITESLLLEDSGAVNQQLKAFSDLGVRLSADDFGIGYSSITNLKRCPLKTVKIDKSFVLDSTEKGQGDKVLIRAIIAMARGLGLEVIAEGIETKAQWEYLKLEGCKFAQGYYFSRPVPMPELKQWLASVKT